MIANFRIALKKK